MKLAAVCCLLVQGLVAAAPTQVHEAGKVQNVTESRSTASSHTVSNATTTSHGSKEKLQATESNSSKGSAPPAPPQKHARLDVGFASFEKSMLDRVVAAMHKSIDSAHMTTEIESACKDNVTQELSRGLKSQLASLKQGIGKTWMSLPADEQKDGYVAQLRLAFEPVFNETVATIDSHLQRSLKHLQVHSVHKKQDDLLAQCETSIAGNILNERCYDVGGEQHIKKVKSFLEVPVAAPRNFCMPSVFEAMLRRLHDSQGLIGMTMQFEAKSMSLQPAPGALDDIVNAASR